MEINLDNWAVEAFLVKKDSRSNISGKDYLSVGKLNIGEDLKSRFKAILEGYICEESTKTFSLDLNDFYDFMSDDSNAKDYYITKGELKEQTDHFDGLMEGLSDNETNLATEDYSNYYYVVLKFSNNGQKIYHFRKLKRISVGNKKKFPIHSGQVEELDGDFIYFDEYIDFIFFKDFSIEGNTDEERKKFSNCILIFNRRNFKNLFRLNEYYIKRSMEFFDNFDFIRVEDVETDKKNPDGSAMKLKEALATNNSLNSQVARVFNRYGNEIKFEKIKELKEKRGDKYSFDIEEGKVKIRDQTNLKDLLDLIDKKIAAPDWNPETPLRYGSKEEEL